MTISLSSPNSSTASIQKNGGDVITFDANNNATFAGNVVTTGTVVSGSAMGMRNRIINGDMRIDQRNAGASVSVSNGTITFITDRWNVYEDTSGSMTSQQSTTSPTGFNNSLLLTVTSAGTATASQLCRIQQRVEGLNVSDLAWGSSSAKTITISFWVRSSLTGTYCVNIRNSAVDRSYVATYTISAANTWEQKSVTIAGDTSGTWLTTNGVGMYVSWDLGAGSNANTTAGAWQAGNYENTSAQANWIGTASATFYITGVQLETGSVATPFERRLYGQELQLCQRYFQVIISGTGYFSNASAQTSTNAWGVYTLGTSMRANPTGYVVSGTNYYRFIAYDLDDFVDSVYVNGQSPNVVAIGNSTQISNTQGRPGVYTAVNAAAFVAAQAEL